MLAALLFRQRCGQQLNQLNQILHGRQDLGEKAQSGSSVHDAAEAVEIARGPASAYMKFPRP